MPNRYEREIEEILRNLEHTEPKQGLGQKFGDRLRRKPTLKAEKRERKTFAVHFTLVEWLLSSAVLCALIAGGYAYILHEGNMLTGIVALVGFVCLLLVAASQFVLQPRRPKSVQYGSMTITPIRRGFVGNIKTRWHLFWMKMRYHRKDDLH